MKLITSKTDGKISIGFIPYYLFTDLSIISSYFYNKIPDKTKTTYHMYFRNVEENIKPFLKSVINDSFFQFCNQKHPNCIQKPIMEMNELYYSNPKPNFHKMNLYGAAANLIPHRDCILFNFYDIYVYRIIIGLSENINHDVATHFPNFNLTHKIQYGEYIAFDFDRTIHQVIKTSNHSSERILMKLHYIVCENCHPYYIYLASLFYRLYYWIARYTEQLGTDPTTFIGFFFGILWEYPFYNKTKYGLLTLSSLLFLCLKKKRNTKHSIYYTFIYLISIYLCIVTWFWIRYVLFRIS